MSETSPPPQWAAFEEPPPSSNNSDDELDSEHHTTRSISPNLKRKGRDVIPQSVAKRVKVMEARGEGSRSNVSQGSGGVNIYSPTPNYAQDRVVRSTARKRGIPVSRTERHNPGSQGPSQKLLDFRSSNTKTSLRRSERARDTEDSEADATSPPASTSPPPENPPVSLSKLRDKDKPSSIFQTVLERSGRRYSDISPKKMTTRPEGSYSIKPRAKLPRRSLPSPNEVIEISSSESEIPSKGPPSAITIGKRPSRTSPEKRRSFTLPKGEEIIVIDDSDEDELPASPSKPTPSRSEPNLPTASATPTTVLQPLLRGSTLNKSSMGKGIHNYTVDEIIRDSPFRSSQNTSYYVKTSSSATNSPAISSNMAKKASIPISDDNMAVDNDVGTSTPPLQSKPERQKARSLDLRLLSSSSTRGANSSRGSINPFIQKPTPLYNSPLDKKLHSFLPTSLTPSNAKASMKNSQPERISSETRKPSSSVTQVPRARKRPSDMNMHGLKEALRGTASISKSPTHPENSQLSRSPSPVSGPSRPRTTKKLPPTSSSSSSSATPARVLPPSHIRKGKYVAGGQVNPLASSSKQSHTPAWQRGKTLAEAIIEASQLNNRNRGLSKFDAIDLTNDEQDDTKKQPPPSSLLQDAIASSQHLESVIKPGELEKPSDTSESPAIVSPVALPPPSSNPLELLGRTVTESETTQDFDQPHSQGRVLDATFRENEKGTLNADASEIMDDTLEYIDDPKPGLIVAQDSDDEMHVVDMLASTTPISDEDQVPSLIPDDLAENFAVTTNDMAMSPRALTTSPDPLDIGTSSRSRSGASISPRPRRRSSASSEDPIALFREDEPFETPPKSHSPSPDDTSGVVRVKTFGGFPSLNWKIWRQDLNNFTPKYRLAKDLPHALQDNINSWTESSQLFPGLRQVMGCVIQENTSLDEPDAPPIEIINVIDSYPTPPWEFYYTNEMWHGEGVPLPDVTNLTSCGCTGKCDPKSKSCACVQRQRQYTGTIVPDFAYDGKNRLKTLDYPIFECNALCGCNDDCRNRVVQNGRKCVVNIQKTEEKGWGVFAGPKKIHQGTFVGIYAGEILTDEVGELRGFKYNKFGRTYLFDLDFHHLKDGNEGWEIKYTVDAYHAGNFTRFLNHSCDPNCRIVPCYVNESNIEKPLLAVFTRRDVEPFEELCFSYSGEYPDDDDENDPRSSPGVVDKENQAVYAKCACKAPNCTGVMFKP